MSFVAKLFQHVLRLVKAMTARHKIREQYDFHTVRSFGTLQIPNLE